MSDCLSIAFLSHLASRGAPTGAERSLSLLAGGMRARGHRVAVVVPGPSIEARPLRAAGVEVHVIPSRACWLAYHDPRSWPVAAAKWLRYAWPEPSTARLRRFVESFGADVVHVNCLPHLRGARAGASAGRPVVWHVREILPPGARRRYFARALARHAARVVAVSEAAAEGLRAEGLGERLLVVPNGVEVGAARSVPDVPPDVQERLDLPPNGVTVGLLGQLIPHKGALDFVEAARRAAACQGSLRFVIAGSGGVRFRRRVAEAIAASGWAERFRLLPPEPTGAGLLAACDVICLATRTPDPLPRTVLEAMAAGKPVVAYRSGGVPEMVRDGETGLLAAPGDVPALARAFVDLAGDGERCRALGRAGAERARALFSLERHLDRMEALFRGLRR